MKLLRLVSLRKLGFRKIAKKFVKLFIYFLSIFIVVKVYGLIFPLDENVIPPEVRITCTFTIGKNKE